MNREILFRGKAINRDNGYFRSNYKNGDWVYGLVTRLYDERFERLPAEMTDINSIGSIEVDYKTIGQYTGLLDKNGKKIFEGDIIFRNYYGEKKTYQVVYNKYIGAFTGQDKEGLYYTTFDGDSECFEVIGTIHDDSDFLEVSE